MKIEKLTENKIRIVINVEDFEINNIDFNSLLTNSPESQTFILSILNQAEKEVGFYTHGCKILIEAIGFPEGNLVFTITKTSEDICKNPQISSSNSLFFKKKPNAKRKLIKVNDKSMIYSFRNFDEFCDFCNALKIEVLSHENLKLICKNTSLYFYDNTYYLIISGINLNYEHLSSFFSVVSEFANQVNNYCNFESKLFEHGKAIFKRNAISNTINIFISSEKNT